MIGLVRRLGAPWLVSIPFMAAGCLAAHSLAYHLVSAREERHGYLAFAPLFLGLLGALAIAGAFRRTRTRSPLVFAALPPLAFVVQEHVERLELVVTEPAFLVGLALQLPFALAALVAARAFLGLADLVVDALTARPPVPRRSPLPAAPPAAPDSPRPSLLAGSCSSRAPPAVA
jgi:hypothetical protein